MAFSLTPSDLAATIRRCATEIGFSACGFASVCDVPDDVWRHWQLWIEQGMHDEMLYMERYGNVRRNPIELLPGARTVVSVALNYYPAHRLPSDNPRFAYYAYGVDYHDIMRDMLRRLADMIQAVQPCECRVCCDTAPIFERYWAVQAGLGFIGRNSQLIIPHKGSYFFLGELITTLDIEPSVPCVLSCGNCNKCVDACPVKAITNNRYIDARRCISCRTIENRNEIPLSVASQMGRRVYGCDTCQEVCPHNSNAAPTTHPLLQPSASMQELTYEKLKNLTPEDFNKIFRHSAVKRVKYEGLMRNVKALNPLLFDKTID